MIEGEKGERKMFEKCLLEKVTSYEADNKFGRSTKTTTIFRHKICTEKGYLIYSGKFLGLKTGEQFNMKATIKRREQYGVRVSRPKLFPVSVDKQIPLI